MLCSLDNVFTFEVWTQGMLARLWLVIRARWMESVAGVAVAVVGVNVLRIIPRTGIVDRRSPVLIRSAHVGAENAIAGSGGILTGIDLGAYRCPAMFRRPAAVRVLTVPVIVRVA